ncbi:hypothetical protein [Granulibacter bethesdensis]|uniref:hypothetical protein n=1 Tax=Granulibacter bethesdensis TaxID=364410 RepID=UPI0003F1CD4C|nr:hypothetical protein [Granulibacter bethesdensis]AHJ68614.1 Hypothetical protein GbCGDNIH2_7139 [Granulibacter bethesdensis]
MADHTAVFLVLCGPDGCAAQDGSFHPADTVINRIVCNVDNDGKPDFEFRDVIRNENGEPERDENGHVKTKQSTQYMLVPDDGRPLYSEVRE